MSSDGEEGRESGFFCFFPAPQSLYLAMKRMEELEKANGIQRKKSPEPNVSGFYDRIIESKKFGPNYTPASKKKAETAEGPP